MILQALYDYYHRKANSSGENGIAPLGMEWKEIPFVIVIDSEGNFRNLEERDLNNSFFLVPRSEEHRGIHSWKFAHDFWGYSSYILGVSDKKEFNDGEEKAKENAFKRHSTFLQNIEKHCITHPDNKEFQAVKLFYKNKTNKALVQNHTLWKKLKNKSGINFSFRLVTEESLVAQHLDLRVQTTEPVLDSTNSRICLITGKKYSIKRLHASIQIIGGAPNSKLVCFNNSSENSYNKKQGMNAPISELAEFAYTTALKELLSKESSNKFKLGDTTFVFWSEKNKLFEDIFACSCLPKDEDDPNKCIKAVMEYLEAPFKGKHSEIEENHFFLLGLEQPSKGRLSVRHWQVGTIKYFAENLRKHFDDFRIEEEVNCSLYNILQQLYTSRKDIKGKYPSYIGSCAKVRG